MSGGIMKVVPRLASKVFGYTADFGTSAAVDCSTPAVEGICGVDPKGNFVPKLATEAKIAQDGKSITFTLRKGVKFHDGTDFNAQAVKWNLDISKQAKLTGSETWTSIDVVDDYTVRINLTRFDNTLINQLANTSGRIVSPTAVQKNGVDWAHTNPVGTGPFKFVSFKPDAEINWTRFDEYWGGKPYLDGIQTVFMTDEMAKSAALQSGAVDVLFNVTPEMGVDLRAKKFNVASGGTQDNLVCLVPDSGNQSSPLSNPKVRQAIEYAIDKNALKELGNGFWTPLTQPITPNTLGYTENFPGRAYDPNKAKQLLAEAGYPNGLKIQAIFSLSNISPLDAMTVVQQYLSKVGITLDLQQVPSNTRTEFSQKGWQNGFISLGIFSGNNYLSGLQYNFTGNLFKSMKSPDGFKDLLTQAAVAPDPATGETLSRKVAMMIHDDAMIIPLWSAPQNIYAQQTYVRDANLYTNGSYDWTPSKAWLDK
jgi:peptide/nickel transport system substrate-binding protein